MGVNNPDAAPAPEVIIESAQAVLPANLPIIVLPAATIAHIYFCQRLTIDGILDLSLKRHK